MQHVPGRSTLALFAFLLAAPLSAQEAPAPQAEPAPSIVGALSAVSAEVRTYNDHVVTLASPFMEGRVPGSRGMEIAKEYIQHYLELAGLQPGFPAAEDAETSAPSWRQGFPLSGTLELASQALSVQGGTTFTSKTDFIAMSYGGSGDITGEVVFAGYSIRRGPDDYETFVDDDDLTGKIALILRFEPMDENGKSKWSKRGRWTGRGGFSTKLRALDSRKPAAVIIVNTPGADDPRIKELVPLRGGRQRLDVPVINMMGEAAAKLVAQIAPDGPSLLELRKMADEKGGLVPLGGEVHLQVDLQRKPLIAENVGGVLPGRGALADEYIVIGAHLDHLGMGNFGSRSGPGKLHPGADDNASGSAAIIMLADRLARAYDELPEIADARSILFVTFSAEESGLNGSRYLANNPIVPTEQIAMMLNFDMIGRIINGRLSVSGAQTGKGMKEWLQPFFDETPLEIVQPANMSGASDHTSFYQKDIPVLFGIIADFHGDYHTPKDVSSKINRVDAVHTIDLFEDILFGLATRPERFEFQKPPPRERRSSRGEAEVTTPAASSRGDIKVRFGIRPESYDETEGGVVVGGVTDGSSAAEAGLQKGDRLVKWNGKEIEGVAAWMGMLREQKPGDKIQVTVERGKEELILWATLKAPAEAGE